MRITSQTSTDTVSNFVPMYYLLTTARDKYTLVAKILGLDRHFPTENLPKATEV
jgi:hypothetical protein